MSSSSANTGHKRPGRPRKRLEADAVSVDGIIRSPASPEDVVEFVYSKPLVMKQMVSIFKAYEAPEVNIDFLPDKIIFSGRDHTGLISIAVEFSAADMNLYYCARPHCVMVKRDNLEIAFSPLERSHYKMNIVVKENMLSLLYIVFFDSVYESEDQFEIEVAPRASAPAAAASADAPEAPRGDFADGASYPVRFTVDGHHLKKKINELRRVSANMTFQKMSGGPLQITFGDVARVIYVGTYKAAQRIKLITTLSPGDLFAVSIKIGAIRPFMTVNLGDDITIFADRDRPFVIQTYLDKRGERSTIVARLFVSVSK